MLFAELKNKSMHVHVYVYMLNASKRYLYFSNGHIPHPQNHHLNLQHS